VPALAQSSREPMFFGGPEARAPADQNQRMGLED